ncbi:helix-turn-helix transcriptional regulator [Dactylosporangium sp. NPDC051484]|uniref:helix-turn-helix domain-containing protein n=1 Tax=Dactylosporangium sp. NPDC051484 TaxID=3154942 RepID=UPI00344F5174
MRNKLSTDGRALRAIRQAKGWDLRGFASHVDISESHLGNAECGRRDLTPPKLKRVADALGVNVTDITVHFQGAV